MKLYTKNAIYILAMAACLCVSGCDFRSGGMDEKEAKMRDVTGPDAVRMTGAYALSSSLVLSWTNPTNSDFDHVTVTWSAGTASPVAADVGDGATEYAIEGLVPETEYTVRLVTVDENENVTEQEALFSISTTEAGREDYLFVYTVADLDAVRGGVTGYSGWGLDCNYILMADLDLGIAPYNTGAGWAPIGADEASSFTGAFNGNGHSIDGLYINDLGTANRGLFGCVQDAEVFGLRVTDADVRGGRFSGVIAGITANSVIFDCRAEGSVAGGLDTVGGITGLLNHTVMSDCHSSATVTGSGDYVGGLVGYAHDSSVIMCHSSGDVVGSARYIGGLVGCNDASSISCSYSSAAAAGNTIGSSDVGGLVGANRTAGIITNCYAVGNVTGVGDNIGGLAGGNYNGSTIEFSYAAGLVTAMETTYRGGLVGYNGSDTTYTSCFYDTIVTTMTIYDQDFGEPASTADMKLEETFTDITDPWDFNAVWDIDEAGTINGGYPYLRENYQNF